MDRIQHEQQFLGICLEDPRVAHDAVMKLRVSANDFVAASHREVWSAIVSLVNRNEPTDVLTVNEELRRSCSHIGAEDIRAIQWHGQHFEQGVTPAEMLERFSPAVVRMNRQGRSVGALVEEAVRLMGDMEELGPIVALLHRLQRDCATSASDPDVTDSGVLSVSALAGTIIEFLDAEKFAPEDDPEALRECAESARDFAKRLERGLGPILMVAQAAIRMRPLNVTADQIRSSPSHLSGGMGRGLADLLDGIGALRRAAEQWERDKS